MDIVQLCEVIMLVSFGFSRPFNIYKSWGSGTARGKSLTFELIVVFGYTVGALGKLILWKRTGLWAYSIWFYFADIFMVLIDICLYLRNAALDRKADAASSDPARLR